MHMADALLSPATGAIMAAVSVGAMGYSVYKIKQDELGDKKVPIMAVAGAFVFAAQMVNFTIPATGSSGHIGGGILLAAMLGGFPSLLTIAAVLVIQALFFADGGLLALGCNIFNMGVIPCLIVYPLFQRIVRKGFTYKRIVLASVLSTVAALQLGAFSVVLETLASGVTQLPFGTFVLMMQPIHLAIGVVEGLITAAVLSFVYRTRPELMESVNSGECVTAGVSMKKLLIALAVLTVVTGGLLSLFASAYPDGLEWSMEKVAGTTELQTNGDAFEQAAVIQEETAFLPDYDFAQPNEGGISGTTISGLVGGAMTFLLAGITGFTISHIKKRKQKASA